MSTNKTYKNIVHYKFHYNDKPIFITSYIKYIMLVSNRINSTEIHSHFRKRMPIRLLYDLIPALKRDFSILMPRLIVEFLQFSMRNDSHLIISLANLHKYSG